MALAALPLMLTLASLGAATLLDPSYAVFVIHSTILGLLSTRFAWMKNPWPRNQEMGIELTDDHIRLGEQQIPRDDIKAGFVVTSTEGDPQITLVRRGLQPNIELKVPDEESAWRLLRSLGLAANQSITEVRGMSLVFASIKRQILVTIGTMMGFAALGSLLATLIGPAVIPIATFTMVMALVGLLFWPSKLQVGADGVLIRWAWHERFIPHEQIESVFAHEAGFGNQRRHLVRLSLTSGEDVELPMATVNFERERATLLAQRINEAIGANRNGVVAEDSALLRRGERSVHEWLGLLRAVTQRATHRSAPMKLERLWKFVEDPACEAVTRGAAAAALQPHLDDADKKRLRIAAKATAQPRLRITLDAVADDAEEAEVEAALAELDELDAAKA
jgi:hypothetical protein